MSKNLTRKVLALASGLTLGASGLIALPASAAVGDVSLSPSTGTTYSVFSTDAFSLNTKVSALLPASVEDGTLSYVINNPDKIGLAIDMGAAGAVDGETVKLTGYTALGASVTVANALKVYDEGTTPLFSGSEANELLGKFLVDFDHHNIVKLVVSNIAAGATSKADTWIIEAVDTSAAGDDTAAIAYSARDVTNLAYGSSYGTVAIDIQAGLEQDGVLTTVENGSAIRTITFHDPSEVSLISTVERFRASGFDLTTPFTATVSVLELNDAADTYVAGTMKFSADINLNQVDLTKWKVAVASSVDADKNDSSAIDLRVSGEAFAVANTNFEVLTPAGYEAGKLNEAGKLYFRTATDSNNLTAGATYKVSFRHTADVAPFSDFDSPAVEVLATAAVATNVEALISTPLDALQDDAQDVSISVRPGSKTLTFTAQANNATNGDLEVANIPVLAVVTAKTFIATGESVSVSGSTGRVTLKDQSIVSTSLTNSDGQVTFVVSSTTALKGQEIDVEFFVLKADDTFTSAKVNGAGNVVYKTTYAASTAETIKADSTVVASAKPTVTFTVTDSFGEPVNSNAKGTFNVELRAPDKLKLELHAPVAADGTVSFTFDNYLTAGQADVLTAKVYTGSSTSQTAAGFQTTINLYSVVAVQAINVTKEITAVEVDYVDYISGKTTKAAPGPTGGTTYTGTVVDDNGAGVPGAQVVISGASMQFLNGTVFSKDTVTLNTTAAGTFSIKFWTHALSATGADITVSSGSKTAITKVKSVIAGPISAGNLIMSWNLPSNPVFNTTYAVTGTVTDVWGNPVSGVTLTFAGEAAALFNATPSAQQNTNAKGQATVYLRSIKDVSGLGAVSMTAATGDRTVSNAAGFLTDVVGTSWDESSWVNPISAEITLLTEAVVASGDKKVNAGSFKGYVALYALGYEGQRMSAKVGNDWIIVPSIPARTNDLFRAVDFVGAGVDISVRIYIDRVLLATIPLLTK